MIISCPACHAQFHLQPTALGASGRTVRCSSCGERWFAEPFIESPPTPAPPFMADEPDRRPGGRGIGLTSWLAGALLLVLLAALIVGRDAIATRVPAMISLYQRLGFALELPSGIELRGLASERRIAHGKPVLVVSGEISNNSAQRRQVPQIRVALLDAERRELQHGLFDPPEPALGPGGVAQFELAMGAPPEGASDVEVSFGAERDRP